MPIITTLKCPPWHSTPKPQDAGGKKDPISFQRQRKTEEKRSRIRLLSTCNRLSIRLPLNGICICLPLLLQKITTHLMPYDNINLLSLQLWRSGIPNRSQWTELNQQAELHFFWKLWKICFFAFSSFWRSPVFFGSWPLYLQSQRRSIFKSLSLFPPPHLCLYSHIFFCDSNSPASLLYLIHQDNLLVSKSLI